jgi:hypothetical protein
MKRYALWTLLTIGTALTAQDMIKYEIEPTIGYNNFDSSSKMESTFMYGIRGTIHPNSYYGYRLSYERSDDVHYGKGAEKKSTDLQRVSGQILINGEEEYNVIPYILLGVGYEILSDEIKNDVSQGYVEGGIGFKYHMKNDLIFDLEAKAMKKFDTDDVDYMVNFGLGYLFNPELSRPKFFQPTLFTKKRVEKQSIKPKTVKHTTIQPVKKPTVNRFTQPIQGEKKKLTIKPIAKVDTKNSDKITALYTFKEEDLTRKKYKKYKEISKTNIVSDSPKNIYIQMAAWNKKVDEKLLSKIEKGGYNFELKDATRANKDVQLVLVGPFDNISDAKSVHKDLRKMAKDAFITKI